MIINETDQRQESIEEAAKAMMTAARTAPKGCGIDTLKIAMVTGDDIKRLADTMRKDEVALGRAFFLRDAGNVEQSQAVVLIGCDDSVRNLNCAICGYPTCKAKIEQAPATPCAFNTTDLGIALGSAISIAADLRVDNRIMYSAGVAAQNLGLLPGSIAIFAIPLSASRKSIFFDRTHAAPSCNK